MQLYIIKLHLENVISYFINLLIYFVQLFVTDFMRHILIYGGKIYEPEIKHNTIIEHREDDAVVKIGC